MLRQWINFQLQVLVCRVTFDPKEFLEDVLEVVLSEVGQELAHVHVALPVAVHVKRELSEARQPPEGSDITGRLYLPASASNRLPVPAAQHGVEFPGVAHRPLNADDPRFSREAKSREFKFPRKGKDVPTLGFAVDVVHVQPHAAKLGIGTRVRG